MEIDQQTCSDRCEEVDALQYARVSFPHCRRQAYQRKLMGLQGSRAPNTEEQLVVVNNIERVFEWMATTPEVSIASS